MPSKEELAALMASDGDFEKKISLLKKAVVTVTRQKQEVEARQGELQEELRITAQHLAEAQQENTALQRRIKTLEVELEQERSSGSAFGQNMLKGLSSIMGNTDKADRSGRGRGSGGGATTQHLSLSAEDVERLIGENEQLHRQIYTCKTKLNDAQRVATDESAALKGEVERLQREIQALQRSRESLGATCDHLRADALYERALGDFCRHYFVARLVRPPSGPTVSPIGTHLEFDWPAKRLLPTSPNSSASVALIPVEVREHVIHTLQGAAATVKTLLRGISVLTVVLREQLPLRERATVHYMECLCDRLSVFLDAHNAKKDHLIHALEELEDSLLHMAHMGEDGEDALPSPELLVASQDEILSLLQKWVALLRSQLPLLVESCVSYLPLSHVYGRHGGDADAVDEGHSDNANANPRQDVTARTKFVEDVTQNGCATLAAVEGSLAALRFLVQQSPGVSRFHDAQSDEDDVRRQPTPLPDERTAAGSLRGLPASQELCTLLALQQFWWAGCAAVRSLHASTHALCRYLVEIADACNKSEVREALYYVRKCLQTLIPASADAAALPSGVCYDSDAAVEEGTSSGFPPCCSALPAEGPSRSQTTTAHLSSSSPSSHETGRQAINSETVEELMAALSAADRAAVSYYTQMNYLFLEMSDKEDALQTAQNTVEHLQRVLTSERAEAEQTRLVLQSQISVLSMQLVEAADASMALPSS